MRPIRNPEWHWAARVVGGAAIATSRPGQVQPAPPDGGYVQRLHLSARHAEENALQSGAKSLPFGFPTSSGKTAANGAPARRQAFAAGPWCSRTALPAWRAPPEVLAFHEAFADIVAIFQHFTLPELLRFEIARLRGDLTQASMLSDLARHFGEAQHSGLALRRGVDRSDPSIKRPAGPTSDEEGAPPWGETMHGSARAWGDPGRRCSRLSSRSISVARTT
jgi:hypothetical protein